MMIRLLMFFLLAVSISLPAIAQQKKLIPLRITDTVPDIEFQMINYKQPTVKLSDFRGKLLILDFWSRWCSVCIAQFPKVKALQEQFKNELVILPIGYQSGIQWDNIKNFYNQKRIKGQPIEIASAIQQTNRDTILNQLFPFRGVPLLVWIDYSGAVIGMTTYHAMTADLITVYLKEQRRLRRNRNNPLQK